MTGKDLRREHLRQGCWFQDHHGDPVVSMDVLAPLALITVEPEEPIPFIHPRKGLVQATWFC